jgi:L-arginine dehydrogenase
MDKLVYSHHLESTMPSTPSVMTQAQVRELLAQVDVPQTLRKLFRDLAAGQAVQPAQQWVEFPQGAGDFINYLGVLAEDQVYGIKTSPYIVREQGPLVTAWTLLMSTRTGQPLLLCDASELTTARTAATTAVAVEALAQPQAQRLAVIGSGALARAHVHYVKGLRDWQSINLYSPGLKNKSAEELASLTDLDSRLRLTDSLEAALHDADVVMLCTSSAKAVLDPQVLIKPALITSISTNAPRAHEVPPQCLNDMEVFCDYRQTTPGSAGEMLIAAEQHGWDASRIIGDLPELLSERVARPDYDRHVFFRSIGLGLEDVALANALYRLNN